MSGWRDGDGRTAAERKKIQGAEERARFAADVRHRPLTLLKGLLGFGFILILVFALLFALN